MTKQAHSRRLAALEDQLKPPEPEHTIAARYIDLATGKVVGAAPARPLSPGERADYRRGIAEVVWYD
jgi:hypothetical protein